MAILVLAGLLVTVGIACAAVAWSVKKNVNNYYFPKQEILKEGSTLALPNGQTIMLAEIQKPATNVPGNRPIYVLALKDNQGTKIRDISFDPLNAEERYTSPDLTLTIKNNPQENDSLLIEVNSGKNRN